MQGSDLSRPSPVLTTLRLFVALATLVFVPFARRVKVEQCIPRQRACRYAGQKERQQRD